MSWKCRFISLNIAVAFLAAAAHCRAGFRSQFVMTPRYFSAQFTVLLHVIFCWVVMSDMHRSALVWITLEQPFVRPLLQFYGDRPVTSACHPHRRWLSTLRIIRKYFDTAFDPVRQVINIKQEQEGTESGESTLSQLFIVTYESKDLRTYDLYNGMTTIDASYVASQ